MKIYFTSWCLIWIILFSIGCTKNEDDHLNYYDDIIYLQDNIPYDTLHSVQTWDFDEIGTPFRMELIDSLLFMTERNRNEELSPIHVINTNNWEYERGLLNFGDGPNEVMIAQSIFANGTTLSVLDPFNTKIVYDVFSEGENETILTEGVMLTQHVSDDEFYYLTGIHNETNRVLKFTKEGNLVDDFLPLPFLDDNLPINPHHHLWQNELAISNDLNKLILASRHASRIDIYDFETEYIQTIAGPKNHSIKYDYTSNAGRPFSFQEDQRDHYIDLSIRGELLYALFSGELQSANDSNFGSYIHVFDLNNGELIEAYKLNNPAMSIHASNELGLLLIEHYPETGVALVEAP
ncbi:MAG: BF3164 family lipoprotein [Balneolales bacterium]